MNKQLIIPFFNDKMVGVKKVQGRSDISKLTLITLTLRLIVVFVMVAYM